MEKQIVLTRESYDAKVKELEQLKTTGRDEIAERIKVARDFGDLSENSEFDDAKEEEAKNASRINEIRTILATAKVIDAANGLEVSIGCTVELTDAKGKKTTFTIVGTTETNSLEHKISNESPAGAAVIGHEVGDHVSFSSPSGKVREYTITNVTR